MNRIQNGEAENPYLTARLKWNNEVEKAFSGERTWKALALILGLCVLAAVAGLTWIGAQSKFIPYVVEVSQLGEAVAVRPADRAAPADARVIRASLSAWVAAARGVTADVDLE